MWVPTCKSELNKGKGLSKTVWTRPFIPSIVVFLRLDKTVDFWIKAAVTKVRFSIFNSSSSWQRIQVYSVVSVALEAARSGPKHWTTLGRIGSSMVSTVERLSSSVFNLGRFCVVSSNNCLFSFMKFFWAFFIWSMTFLRLSAANRFFKVSLSSITSSITSFLISSTTSILVTIPETLCQVLMVQFSNSLWLSIRWDPTKRFIFSYSSNFWLFKVKLTR